jgi:hypothetical protein
VRIANRPSLLLSFYQDPECSFELLALDETPTQVNLRVNLGYAVRRLSGCGPRKLDHLANGIVPAGKGQLALQDLGIRDDLGVSAAPRQLAQTVHAYLVFLCAFTVEYGYIVGPIAGHGSATRNIT